MCTDRRRRETSAIRWGSRRGQSWRGYLRVQPDLIAGEVRIRPGFPSDWGRASLKHKDFDFSWKSDGLKETYEFNSRLAKVVPLSLKLTARTTNLPVLTANGRRLAV